MGDVQLNWTAGTDNVGVTANEIYESGNLVASVGAVTQHTLVGEAAGAKAYTVRAKDAAGNTSVDSNIANVTVPAGGFDPASNPNLVTWLTSADLSKMYQDEAKTIAANANGQSVRRIENSVTGGHDFNVFSDADRPVLTIPGTAPRLSSLTWSSTRMHLRSVGGVSTYKFLHGASASGTIIFRGRMAAGTDGLNVTLLTNNFLSNTTPGFYIWRRTDHTISVVTVSGGAQTLNYRTTGLTVAEATGDFVVEVTFNGAGVGNGSVRVNGVQETFDVGVGVDEDADQELYLGARAATPLWNHDGEMDQIMILNAPIDQGFRDGYNSYNPTPS